MLPKFPTFKQLEINDKDAISRLALSHKPYSDFGFTSIFSWDTAQDIELCTLNDNLVLKFSDYIDGSKFLTFIGNHSIDETAVELLEYATSNNLISELRLMPESVVNMLKSPEKFDIKEDRDNFDYILGVEDQVELAGKAHAKRRYVLNKFNAAYEGKINIIPLELSDKLVQDRIISLFEEWEKGRQKTRSETENELKAIKRIIEYANHLDIRALGVYINEVFAGFSIFEIVQDGYGVIHFEKADVSYKGIFQFLKHIAAKELKNNKQSFINIEQDLGIEGLRESKTTHHPIHFLKKYTVSLAK